MACPAANTFPSKRRKTEGIANVIETKSRIVRRKDDRRIKLDSEQVIDRVVVLPVIEPANTDPPGSGS